MAKRLRLFFAQLVYYNRATRPKYIALFIAIFKHKYIIETNDFHISYVIDGPEHFFNIIYNTNLVIRSIFAANFN